MIAVEICINCDSNQTVSESVGAAYSGGASTVELCGSMHLDGLTPTANQIIDSRNAFKNRVGLMVMIRPRQGDFYFSAQELDTMIRQINIASDSGADGIVIGVLNRKDNSVDTTSLSYLMEECLKKNLQVTFHRAFDATPNPIETLELLIDFGINRVLTSGTEWGQSKTALHGIEKLKQIVEISRNKIEVVIGGGIRSRNVTEVLNSVPLKNNKVSVHSYSGVQVNGITTLDEVKSLVEIVGKIEYL